MPVRKLINWLRGNRKPAEKSAGGSAPLIIVITPEAEVRDEVRIVKKLFEAGLTRLHLRRHDWDVADHRDWLQEIPKKYRDRIVLHGHAELVTEFGLAGLHLQSTRAPQRGGRGPKGKGRSGVPEGVALSRSCHDYSELLQGPKHCEYATLGPVFPSISKRGYAPRRTPEEFAATVDYWKKENDGHPVVALGGVTPENIGEVRAMGFDGVAVVGAVWEAHEPVRAFKALVAAWNAAK